MGELLQGGTSAINAEAGNCSSLSEVYDGAIYLQLPER
jgi:hypothetical protein